MIISLVTVLAALTSPVVHADTTIQRGVRIPAGPAVALSEILARPEAYTGRAVVIEGVIVRSCTAMGCWMQVAPAVDAKGLRVRFKDESFFIPLSAAGMSARAIGIAVIIPRTAEEATTAEQAGRFVRRATTGTGMVEIEFEATGVVLTGGGPVKESGGHGAGHGSGSH